jgi:hypothetical protein
VIAIMVMLSIILTASVLYPNITGRQILMILAGGSIVTVLAAITTAWLRRSEATQMQVIDDAQRATWRMPPLDQLPPGRLGGLRRLWMGVLRGYLLIASGLVMVRIAQLVSGGH